MISRTVSILGSTGSIGTQAPTSSGATVTASRFEPSPPAAISTLARQTVEFEVPFVAAARRQRQDLRSALASYAQAPAARPYAPEVVVGADAATTVAAIGADVVLNGITGAIGLRPTLAALASGATLALANKESSSSVATSFRAAARPDQIVPADSEHSAIAQSLRGGRREEVRRLVVTASGDPSGLVSRAIARGDARAGARAPELCDGQGHHHELGDPGQQGPGGHRGAPASTCPSLPSTSSCTRSSDSLDGRVPRRLDHRPDGTATDARADRARPVLAGSPRRHRRAVRLVARTGLGVPSARRRRLPAVRLARRWGRPGHGPAVYNAANEVCVEAFHGGRISFPDIVDTVARVVEAHDGSDHDSSSVEGCCAQTLRAGACHGDRGEGEPMSWLATRRGAHRRPGWALSIALHEVGTWCRAKASECG